MLESYEYRIQLRRDSAVDWESENPVLEQGEAGFDITARKLKIGDGSTAWNSLPYLEGVFLDSSEYDSLKVTEWMATQVDHGTVTSDTALNAEDGYKHFVRIGADNLTISFSNMSDTGYLHELKYIIHNPDGYTFYIEEESTEEYSDYKIIKTAYSVPD